MQTSLSLALLFGLLHLLWVLVVALGWGQNLLDYWLARAHFVNQVYTVRAPDLSLAVLGVLWAFLGGLVVGWLFACFWNLFAKK